jgi:hypothetical protein
LSPCKHHLLISQYFIKNNVNIAENFIKHSPLKYYTEKGTKRYIKINLISLVTSQESSKLGFISFVNDGAYLKNNSVPVCFISAINSNAHCLSEIDKNLIQQPNTVIKKSPKVINIIYSR